MSQPPPSAVVEPRLALPTELPYGRPVRRRIVIPSLLVVALVLVGVLALLHDRVVYYRVDSGSMEPTLPIGSRVAVEPGQPLKVGEMVAFRAPSGALPASPVCANPDQGTGFQAPCGLATPHSSRTTFVKRIVAGPGATVSIRNGHAVVDGRASAEPFASSCGSANCQFPTPVRVPAREYYVLGDNRGTSDDSRFWGPVPASSIIGVLVNCGPLQTDCQPRH